MVVWWLEKIVSSICSSDYFFFFWLLSGCFNSGMSSRDTPMENIRTCCIHRCLEWGQVSKDFPLRCKVYSRMFFQKHLVFVKNAHYWAFSSFLFWRWPEDFGLLSSVAMHSYIGKFQAHKVILKKSMINYRTKGISDTAVHFLFLNTWEKGYCFHNRIVNEANLHLNTF